MYNTRDSIQARGNPVYAWAVNPLERLCVDGDDSPDRTESVRSRNSDYLSSWYSLYTGWTQSKSHQTSLNSALRVTAMWST